MAQIPNPNAQTVSDGLNTYWNVDTQNKHAQLTNADLSVSQSSGAAPDPGAGGTIATAGVVVARVNPAAARTGVILQPGTQPGQMCLVVNEAAASNSITWAAAGTSNVADGAGAALAGLTSRLFVWDSFTSLWYRAA